MNQVFAECVCTLDDQNDADPIEGRRVEREEMHLKERVSFK